METYFELLRRDICYHGDTFTWPPSITKFAQSLQNELKIPSWLKSGSVPYTDERVASLLNQFWASDDVSNVHLWDNTDKFVDGEMAKRLHVVFNAALVDCARIQAVVETENLTDTPYPKESFLVILVRNAILDFHVQLSALEDIPVVLPRHHSGETIPILKYMKKSIYVPLVISICQEMLIEENVPHVEHPSSDDEDSSVESELFKYSPPTMSEFLDNCERTMTLEEVVEEPEDDIIPPSFEAYFLACSPCTAPPAICHIPVLCMADEEQLPVLMSSLLYQRRVWHINEPLIGLGFSKYDSVIKLFVGWLEDDLPSDRVLPRVHLGEIRTPMKLDLSSPSGALVISCFLCGLESCVDSVRGTARHSVGTVIGETRSISSLSWRIDTDTQTEDHASILAHNSTRDIIQWVKSLRYSEIEEKIPLLKRVDSASSSDSAISMPPPRSSTSTQPSRRSLPSDGKKSSIPVIQEPREYADSVPTFCSRLPCSEFAATSQEEDRRVFRWMFDRRVIPQSLPSDLEFRENYGAMTGFIWPDTWYVRDNLPLVDAALEPCVQELLESVAALKMRPGAIKYIPIEEFPIDIRILQHSFSAIFQASRRSREKRELRHNVCEAAWRHDHDRLLFDFFVRLVQPRKTGAALTSHSVVHLEDPRCRPILEATLRLPKNNNLQTEGRQEIQRSTRMLLHHEATDLASWLKSRSAPPEADLQEAENASYVVSQWATWRQETNAENMVQMISKLGQSPLTGRCDALGRLLVQLPDVSSKTVSHFPLVVHSRSSRKYDSGRGRNETRASARSSRRRTDATNKPSSSSLTTPDASRAATNGTRYTMPSSSVFTSDQSLENKRLDLAESLDELTHEVDQLQLGSDATYLELPILAVENKKASDSLAKGTNQLRIYLTASVKFLQVIGITNTPVYGVQTDGPIVVLPAAVLRDDNFVYLFERLVEKLDISTPLGAWHYATILCRLAQNHAQVLEYKFEEIKENVSSMLEAGSQLEGWTLDQQMARLIAENRAKSPKDPKKQRPEAD